MPTDVPPWVDATAQAATRMEEHATAFLAERPRDARDVEDAAVVARLARGIRRKMEGWRSRHVSPATPTK